MPRVFTQHEATHKWEPRMAGKTKIIAAGLVMFGVAALGGMPPQAAAAPVGSMLNQTSTVGELNGMVQQVQSRRDGWDSRNRGDSRQYRGGDSRQYRAGDSRRYRDYDRRYHGPRYRDRRPGYGYNYGGYYYSTPWWLGAAAGLGIAGAIAGTAGRAVGGSAHVAWCENRYRSYNLATDTFTGYDGRTYRCNSPYG